MSNELLRIDQLSQIYKVKGKEFVAVKDFDLVLPDEPASIITIAGESGSGKSTVARVVLGLERPSAGTVTYKGHDITTLDRFHRKQYRREVQAVFQDPYASYNPFYRVRHIFDVVIKNFDLASSKSAATDMIEEALAVVGILGTEVLHKYPHQLSGGQRQRMMMARAYLLKPRLIVADEPVSMVDASLRSMILKIMQDMRDHHGISFLYITHDLSTAYSTTDRLYMLYRGVTTEVGPTMDVIDRATHPYVENLVAAIPRVSARWEGRVALAEDAEFEIDPRGSCPYAPRCPHRHDRCTTQAPDGYPVGPEHRSACFLHDPSGATYESSRPS